MRHSHGYRNRCRKLLRKSPKEKSKGILGRLLIEYNVGDKVHIDISPDAIKTAPHRRYQGKTGTIIGVRGRAYLVEVVMGGKKKIMITTKEHLTPVKPASANPSSIV